MRRVGQFLSLLLLLTAGVLWIAQPSSALDEARAGKGPGIKIRTGDGTEKVYFNELADAGFKPLEDEKYVLKDADGKKTGSVTVNAQRPGYALGDWYKAGGVSYKDVGFVEIPRADGAGFVRLYGSQLNPNGRDFEDHRPVAIYKTSQTNGNLNFIRGQFKNDEDDPNAQDAIAFDGDPVLRNRTGVPLTVTVTASPADPVANEAVSFSASVDNEDYVYDYHWSFSDNNKGAENATPVTHTFEDPEDGAFATVTVKSRTDDSAGEGTITFNVKEQEDTGTGTGTGGYTDPGYYDPGYSDSYTTPSYTDPGGLDVPNSTDDTATTETPKAEEEADPTQTEPTGTPVEGELLQDAAVVPEGTSAPPEDSSAPPEPTTPVPTVQQNRSVPSSVLTGMAVVGLLGLGTFTELGSAGSGPGRLRRLNPFGRGKK